MSSVQGTSGLCDDHWSGVAIPPLQVERAEAVIPQWYVTFDSFRSPISTSLMARYQLRVSMYVG